MPVLPQKVKLSENLQYGSSQMQIQQKPNVETLAIRQEQILLPNNTDWGFALSFYL